MSRPCAECGVIRTRFFDLHVAELRDEAVKLLRRAIEHTEAGEQVQALEVLQGVDATQWYAEQATQPTVLSVCDVFEQTVRGVRSECQA